MRQRLTNGRDFYPPTRMYDRVPNKLLLLRTTKGFKMVQKESKFNQSEDGTVFDVVIMEALVFVK